MKCISRPTLTCCLLASTLGASGAADMNRTITMEELKKFIEDRMKGIDRDLSTLTRALTTPAPEPAPPEDDTFSRRIIIAMWLAISGIYMGLYYLLHLWAKGKIARKRAESEARIAASIRAEKERILALPEIRPIIRKNSRQRPRRSLSGTRVHFEPKPADGDQAGSPPQSLPDSESPPCEASTEITIALVHTPQYSPEDETQETRSSPDEADSPSEDEVHLQID